MVMIMTVVTTTVRLLILPVTVRVVAVMRLMITM